jgi:hypothetical protein
MTEETREQLLLRLRTRRAFDEKWATTNFVVSQVFTATAIFASFGVALVAAANIVTSPIALAILTAIPGTVIVIDRSFLFAARWRWHCTVATRFIALEQMLLFEGGTVEKVSQAMTTFLSDMEERYPTGKAEGLPMNIPKAKQIAQQRGGCDADKLRA